MAKRLNGPGKVTSEWTQRQVSVAKVERDATHKLTRSILFVFLTAGIWIQNAQLQIFNWLIREILKFRDLKFSLMRLLKDSSWLTVKQKPLMPH